MSVEAEESTAETAQAQAPWMQRARVMFSAVLMRCFLLR